MILDINIIFGSLCDTNMDVTVHEVEKITMKAKRLSSDGLQVITLYIQTDRDMHEIVCFADNPSQDIEFKDIGTGSLYD